MPSKHKKTAHKHPQKSTGKSKKEDDDDALLDQLIAQRPADAPQQQQARKQPAVRKGLSDRIGGTDTNGAKYRDVDDMWQKELSGDLDDAKTGWYGKAIDYWSKVPATMDGVLGGLSEIHVVDVKESLQFLNTFTIAHGLGRKRALDCGAGIGRLTKHVLLPLGIEKVDLLEPLPHMVEEAMSKELADVKDKIGESYITSMQKIKMEHMYDVILIQWAAIYLTDDDFVAFLQQCKEHLVPNTGIVFFKENCSAGTEFVVDKDDSSLTRSDVHYKRIFKRAGMKVVAEAKQVDWPDKLYTVKMYALRSDGSGAATVRTSDAAPVDEDEAM